MSKQPPPSDDAVRLMHRLRTYGKQHEFAVSDELAARQIDALCEQRVEAERERVNIEWEERTGLDRFDRPFRAPAERPAPEGPAYQIGDCPCGYGWDCKETGCRRPMPRDPKAWSDADA